LTSTVGKSTPTVGWDTYSTWARIGITYKFINDGYQIRIKLKRGRLLRKRRLRRSTRNDRLRLLAMTAFLRETAPASFPLAIPELSF